MAKDIVVRLIADARNWVKGHGDAEKATDGLSKRTQAANKIFGSSVDAISNFASSLTSKLGPAGGAAEGAVGGIIGALGDMPPAMGAVVGAAGAMGTGVAAGVGVSVARFQELSGEVRQLTLATGMQAEEASKWNAVARDMGIQTDDLHETFAELALRAVEQKDALAELGVQIAYNKDGTVDLSSTLMNVSDAYNRTTDASKKMLIGDTALGDQWFKLMPLLKAGRGEIEKLGNAAQRRGQIFSQKDLDSAAEMQEQMREFRAVLDGVMVSIGRRAIPKLTEDISTLAVVFDDVAGKTKAVGRALEEIDQSGDGGFGILDFIKAAGGGETRKGLDRYVTGLKEAKEAADSLGPSGLAAARAQSAMAAATGEAAKALQADKFDEAAEAQGRLSRRYEDSRDSAARLRDEQQKLTDAIERSYQTTLSAIDVEARWQRTQEETTDSIRELQWRTNEAKEATRQFGASSTEAANANEAQRRQLIATRDQLVEAAKATADNAKAQAENNGQTLTAAQYNAIVRDELQRLSDTAGDPVLGAQIQRYIDKLNATGAAAQYAHGQVAELARQAAILAGATQGQGMGIITSAAQAERLGRATGGPVIGGQPYMVGESGPELLTAGQSATVIPAQMTRQIVAGAATGSGGGGPTIIVNTPIGEPTQVVRWIAEQLRSYERERR